MGGRRHCHHTADAGLVPMPRVEEQTVLRWQPQRERIRIGPHPQRAPAIRTARDGPCEVESGVGLWLVH